ncbi:hypothetical protein H2201_009040 [Coniosporium apollinis]|uniref:Uncharacterized protein n=2 Tax=Coniosporium TaxID=2810619 RepID=A0ABQ9NFP3_9PEZI|nr:hypothetical protein H2199_009207 [Cladosporium sp. JES 115]KAJ9654164.1 hypothetical protein H2201_009040 [Coniosporium apollinis]
MSGHRLVLDDMNGKLMQLGYVNGEKLRKIFEALKANIPPWDELTQISGCADQDIDAKVREYLEFERVRNKIDLPTPIPKRPLTAEERKEFEAEGGKFKGAMKRFLKWSVSVLFTPGSNNPREIVIYGDVGEPSKVFVVFHCVKENGVWKKVP